MQTVRKMLLLDEGGYMFFKMMSHNGFRVHLGVFWTEYGLCVDPVWIGVDLNRITN